MAASAKFRHLLMFVSARRLSTVRFPSIPLFHAKANPDAKAIIEPGGGGSTFRSLLNGASVLSAAILPKGSLAEARVSYLLPNDSSYVKTSFAIWRIGGIAVPLCHSHPPAELQYVISDSGSDIVVTNRAFLPLVQQAITPKQRVVIVDEVLESSAATADISSEQSGVERLGQDSRAMLVYTSGTTGKPKGVVYTHGMIQAQVRMLLHAWGWSANDTILHALPLHHVHGIVNALLCPLTIGARCEMLPKFDAASVWDRLLSGDITVFMGVPTMYAKLLSFMESASEDRRAMVKYQCLKHVRLMVSGSAALPETVLKAWQELTGHVLLERYGMTEIGMALSYTLQGPRFPGSVGTPLPDVQVRIVDSEGNESTEGELRVKGPAVFKEYWGKPDATAKEFDAEGWFKTGDVASFDGEKYRILGRASVDIIKSGGYKISALDIERVLLQHSAIDECAVIGTDDPVWGQRVTAFIVPKKGQTVDTAALQSWSKPHLASYKIPSRVHVVDELPRNAMGKVNKKHLATLLPS